MRRAGWRAAALPIRALFSPGGALDDAGSGHDLIALASLALLVAALGALALPRLFALLDAALLPSGQPRLDAHLDVLRAGLRRYLVAERLVPPLPFVVGGLLVALVAAPVLAGRGVRASAIVRVLAVGAAPLLVQRAGELAAVLGAPGDGLVAGDVARLPARFNVGVAGALSLAGVTATGWPSVVAEATNAFGVWVVALWGWGLSRLDRDLSGSSRTAAHPVWWCGLAVTAYGAGYLLYAALFPYLLVLVMGAP